MEIISVYVTHLIVTYVSNIELWNINGSFCAAFMRWRRQGLMGIDTYAVIFEYICSLDSDCSLNPACYSPSFYFNNFVN